MYLENIREGFQAAYHYALLSDRQCHYIMNYSEHVLKDILFYTRIERFEVKICMLRLFYENFEILSTAPGFVSLINYVLEVNLRWLTINHHSVQDVNDPVNHAQVCAGCNYESEIIQKIKQYALHANLERRGFFYTRRAE